jgi:hypothetical protein
MTYLFTSMADAEVFGEPHFGLLVLLRSLVPGRPWMLFLFIVCLLSMSAVTTGIVHYWANITDAPVAASIIGSVTVVLVTFNLTNVIAQGMLSANQMLLAWSSAGDSLLKLRTYLHATKATPPRLKRVSDLLVVLYDHATRVVYSKSRLEFHRRITFTDEDQEIANAASDEEHLHHVSVMNGPEEESIWSAIAVLTDELTTTDKLDLQTTLLYLNQCTDQVSALLSLRQAYVPLEYNVASVSFFTLTYGIFFPMSTFSIFGWYYMVVLTILLFHLLSNYDMAIRCGDPFSDHAGTLRDMADDVTFITRNELGNKIRQLNKT